jgi:hypothetical protein
MIWIALFVVTATYIPIAIVGQYRNFNNTTTSTTTTTTTTTTTAPPTTTTTAVPITAPPFTTATYYTNLDVNNGNIYVSGFQGLNVLATKFDSNNNFLWYITEVSTEGSIFSDIKVTPDESVYAFGSINGLSSHDFGNGVILSGLSTNDNIVIVRYNSAGIAQWGRTINSVTRGSFNGGAVNGNNEIYGVGYYKEIPANFGNGVILTGTYTTTSTIFMIVKYDSSGNAQWGKTEYSSGFGSSFLNNVAVNSADGSVYAVGDIATYAMAKSHDLGDGVILNTDGFSYVTPFIVKYDQSGITQWARTVTQSVKLLQSEHRYYGNAVSTDGYIYVVGYAGNAPGATIDFGNGVTLTGIIQPQQILIVKYDSIGNAIWAKTDLSLSPFSISYSSFESVTIGADGNIYAVGNIGGAYPFDFGDGVLISGASPNRNQFLVVYSPLGTTLWGTSTLSGTQFSNGLGVATYNNKVYIAGLMNGVDVVFNGTVIDRGTHPAFNRFLFKQ